MTSTTSPTSPTVPSTLATSDQGVVRLVCPSCGSSNVTLDYDATVSLRVMDGVVQSVLVGGIFGARPTNFFCEDCDHQPFPSDEATDAALSQVEATLPCDVERDLNEGWYVFGDSPSD